ncbi:MAG: chromosome segregation protein SMC [Calditrichaeota bacterium]|nr:MAG: chromosome segregation protein SMC [Calditrichota bacterium]
MYLSRLEIFGFKSFAKKTVINFHDGVTAIVGPNGCGKSNVVDAIRWVLGEQKAGTLRSDNMQNVIFNGTRTQKPLGMAEVSLTIENTKNILPIEFSEVVITRRLFRSGESQYLLNNAMCRLKDIIDLFMDTGMGANAYSVIELSMVEKILSGRPEERRQIFEEAAGVTKYKIRRRSALRKLYATEQDLVRISDILSEVEKSVSSLKRQVNKAQRYRDFTEELRETELDYSAYHLEVIQKELAPLAQKMQEVTGERTKISSHLASEEAGLEAEQVKLLEIEKELTEQKQILIEISRKIQAKEEDILVSHERVRAADNARNRAKQEIEELALRLKRLQEEREDALADIDDARAEVKNVEQNQGSAKQALEIIQAAYLKEREHAKNLEENRMRKLESIGEIKKEEERLRTQLEYSSRQHGTIEDGTEDLTARKKQAETRVQDLNQERESVDQERIQVEKEFSASREEIENLRENIDEKKSQQSDILSKLNGRKERLAVLRKILENMDDYPDGVRYLLDESKPANGVFGTVGNLISVESRFRPAIEAALNEAAVSIIVDGPDTAMDAIKQLRSANKGPVTFLPMHALKDEVEREMSTLISENGVVGKAADFVEVEEKFRPLVQSLLASFLVVESFEVAKNLAQTRGDRLISFVTLAGEVMYVSGAIRGGGANDADASLVGRKAVVDELENEISELTKLAATTSFELEKSSELLRNRLQESEKLQIRFKEKNEAYHAIEISLNQARGEVKKYLDRMAELVGEQKNIGEFIAESEERLANLAPALQKEEEERAALEAEYKKFREELEIIENELKEKEISLQKIELEIVTKSSVVKNIENGLLQLDRNENEIKESQKRREEEIIANANRIEELDDHIAEVRETLQDEFAERKKFEEAIGEIEIVYSERKNELDKRDKALRSVRTQRDTLAEEIHQGELRVAELKMNGRNLVEQIHEAYEVDLQQHPVPTEIDRQEAANRINDLKQRLRSMGPVNMLALKDYEVEKERYEFLTTQKNDLLTAEENLKETIKVINNTAYERFDDIFTKVRENFIRVFKSFFANGIADIYLEGDDPLEADIVIDASPKGKKLGNLALLSGGEKTLTALSLLFAIYLVKPSPFCILDEVDAPLDDANTNRFATALTDFSTDTQFIAVTHNKLTMMNAEQLFGVTMETPGISKVVSVKFEEFDKTKNGAVSEPAES